MWFLKKTKFYYLSGINMFSLFVDKILILTEEKELKLPTQIIRISKVKTNFIMNVITQNQI